MHNYHSLWTYWAERLRVSFLLWSFLKVKQWGTESPAIKMYSKKLNTSLKKKKKHYCCCESYFSLVHLFLYQTLKQAKILLYFETPRSLPSFPFFPTVGWTQCPYLSLSGWRLSVRHFSCSSPSLILSSSSRCSMMRADFIFTKCS